MSGVRVKGSLHELDRLERSLRDAPRDLQRELRRRLRDEAGPTVRAVQESILEMRAVEDKDRSFREEIARTVTSSTRIAARGVTVEIVSLGRRMPDGMGNLPAYADSSHGWAHPVFAQGPRFRLGPSRARKYAGRAVVPLVKRGAWTWVHQWGKPGWFERPITGRAPDLRDACQAAIDEVKRKIGG